MIYTLAQGTQNYARRQHYSLYGGVEEFPRTGPIIIARQILPRVAAPAILLTILAVLLSSNTSTSHSGQSGGSNSPVRTSSGGQSIIQMVRPAAQADATAGNSGSPNTNTSGIATTTPHSTPTPAASTTGIAAGPTQTASSLVGGYGSGPVSSAGSTSATPSSVSSGGSGGSVSGGSPSSGVTTTIDVTIPTTSTPVLQTTTNVSSSSFGATANASVPGTGKTASLSVDPSL